MLRAIVCLFAVAAVAAGQSAKYGVGRTPSPDEIRTLGYTVTPDGRGLPAGQGTAREGAQVYELRCKECHGPEGQGADQAGFVGKPEDLRKAPPVRTVGSYWPHATTLWDYTNRAMPFGRPGTLTENQVYAVVAYILHLNGLVGEDETLDAARLSAVKMPNRGNFIPDDRPDTGGAAKPSR